MEIEAIRFVGGFARAGSVKPKIYENATLDPIMAFGQAIASHMVSVLQFYEPYAVNVCLRLLSSTNVIPCFIT